MTGPIQLLALCLLAFDIYSSKAFRPALNAKQGHFTIMKETARVHEEYIYGIK